MVVFWKCNKYNLQAMRKMMIQGLVVLASFFSTWFLLQQVDWISVFKVKKITEKTEEKLSELFWEFFKKNEKEITDQFVTNTIDSLLTKLCVCNNINRSQIKIHLLDKNEVNAFALPNGRIVIYSDLILAAENQEELSGVISHELAHIELNHVMKKLMKEIGLNVLISMITGGSGTDAIGEAAKLLSSTAFDRSMEREADIKAVDYLIKANINPEPFAHFLYKLSDSESDAMKYLSWISTHPDSKERAKDIIEYSVNKAKGAEPVLSQGTWVMLKEKLL